MDMDKEKKTVEENNDVLDFTGVEIRLHQKYDFLPYTFHRIGRILRDDYGSRLDWIWQGYKSNRRSGYQELYRIVRISDGEVIVKCVSLHQLRKFLAAEDYPLYDECSAINKSKRNPGAERFMEAVKNLNKNKD